MYQLTLLTNSIKVLPTFVIGNEITKFKDFDNLHTDKPFHGNLTLC